MNEYLLFISGGEMEREVDGWISADATPDCRGEERAEPEALDVLVDVLYNPYLVMSFG